MIKAGTTIKIYPMYNIKPIIFTIAKDIFPEELFLLITSKYGTESKYEILKPKKS